MSDTPETDALYRDDHKPNLLEHARKLERERDAAYAEMRKLYPTIRGVYDEEVWDRVIPQRNRN